MDKSKLIDKHLENNHRLICGNVHHYEVTGKVKGAFKQCLIEMLQEFEQECKGNKLKQTYEPVLNICDVIASVCDTLLAKASEYEDEANNDYDTEGVQHNLNIGRHDGLMQAIAELNKHLL